MPCRNDWDPPTKAQAENRRAAKLLIALNNIHGLTSSTQLLVDSTNPVLDTDYVKVLCERVGALSDSDRETVLYGDAHDPRARDLATWWEEHQARDEARQEENPDTIASLRAKIALLEERIEHLRKPGPDTARAREERDHFDKALARISLCSQNSMSSKDECGRIARQALDEARKWRIRAPEEQSAWVQRMAAVEDASASDPTAPVIGTPLVNVPATQMVGGKAIDDAMEIAERLALRLVFRNNTRTDSGYESADIAANEVRKELRAALESLAAPRQAEAGPGRHWWPVSKGHADNVCAAAPQQAEPVEIVPRVWREALRKLTFMARTSGGTPGPDEGLQTACAEAETLLSKPYNYPPAAPQQAEPVWVRPDQLQKARQAPFLCRVSPTKDALDLAPLYLHPPADEVRRLRDALDEIESETQDVSIQQIARKALEGK